jgi:uncharacterized repeat protein (TIGR02543 family)
MITFTMFLILAVTPVVSYADSYTITLIADPADGGIVEGGGEFDEGQNTTFSATANEGYFFVGWYRDDGSLLTEDTEFPYDLEMSRTYTARFEKALTVGIIAEPAVGGAVQQSGNGSYVADAPVTLTASANEGYSFVGWFDASSPMEAISTESTYTFDMLVPVSYIARFAPQYRLDTNVSPEEGGTVLGDGMYAGGSIVQLEATPNEDWRFTGWVLPASPETVISTDEKYTFNLDVNTTYTATFARSYAYTGSRVAIAAALIGGGGFAVFILYKRAMVIKKRHIIRNRHR